MRKIYFFTGSVAVLGAVMYLKSAPQEVRSGAWSPSGIMAQARTGASAVRLPDGRVLITGGKTQDDTALSSAELYDPSANTWVDAGAMSVNRVGHTATRLSDGRVL